jgi:hypothetical protein
MQFVSQHALDALGDIACFRVQTCLPENFG